MKNLLKKFTSFLLTCAILAALLPVMSTVKVHAVTQNQQNIVDRANYFFNTTWVCQKTIMGWRDQYTFEAGETYRLPYGQPVNSGQFIGYGVTLEDFLDAAADVNSVYYSRQSEFNGWTSTYYATDCAAFVAMCWGTVRQDCSTLPYFSTNIGVVSTANLSKIQLGDALDSTSVGHVVLVTDLKYDTNGNITHIEITEQTPPQLKRTMHTPESLIEKYGGAFYIYRYYEDVPEAPVRGYVAECSAKAALCNIQITENDTAVMSLPCESTVDETSVQLGTVAADECYIANKIYENTEGELWYRMDMSDGTTGYVNASNTIYQGQILDDITLTDATAPSGHVKGQTFVVNGTVSAVGNALTDTSVYIYSGFGISGSPVTGLKDAVSSNSYTLKNSNIDYSTSFGSLSTGNYTYAISADYKNYYAAQDGTLAMNTGTVVLMEEYFIVLSYSINQSTCAHAYTTTVVKEQNCTDNGTTVKACSKCGLVEKVDVSADGHDYGQWTVDVDATCTTDGSQSRICATCENVATEVISAIGHNYESVFHESDCQSYAHTTYTCANCGDWYMVYADEIMSDWQPELPDVDDSLIESKPQYRSRNYESFESDDGALEGYTQIGSSWTAGESNTIYYVESWPSGFDTTNELYTKYNNAGSKVSSKETEDEKITVESDGIAGYIYYHWCSASDYYHYSYASKTNSHNIFHAYYSETNPDNFRCDTSDMSYKTSDSCCANGNSEWFFVANVKCQKYTTYSKTYTYERWTEWSDWQDEEIVATDSRQVEERTVYRYVNGELGDHDFVDGVCSVCGEVSFVAPTLKPAYTTVSFEGQIQMNIYFDAENVDSLGMDNLGLLTWTSAHPDGTIEDADAIIPGAYANGTRYVVHTNGISAKNLGDTVYFKIYAKLADGSYVYTDMYSTSPRNYAMSILNNASAGENIKALCAAMLNYGAAAQRYFGYKSYSLMNSDLTEEHQALVLPYDETMMDSIVPVDSSKTENFLRSQGAFSSAYPKVSFEGAFSINYYFINTYDIDDSMTLYYWTEEDYAKADVLTEENATAVVPMNYDDVHYWGSVPNIVARKMDSTVYAAATYTCEGEVFCTGVIAYSLGNYCESIAANANSDAQELASLTAVYGYYAEAYFDSL